MPLLTLLLSAPVACGLGEPPRYEMTGEVVELRSATEVVIAHDDIPGFMDAMTMSFVVSEEELLAGVSPGDQVQGTLVLRNIPKLEALEVVAEAEPPERPPSLAPGEAVPVGKLFPTTPVVLAEGLPTRIGQGQEGPVAVTFIYTRCPLPEYCPLVVARMQALQEVLPAGARILAVTLDPEHDTRAVLRAFASEHGAKPGRWDFGRVPPEVLFGFAEKAGLKTHGKGLGITHDLLLLVLDGEGRLVARYRDMKWDLDEVVSLLGGGS